MKAEGPLWSFFHFLQLALRHHRKTPVQFSSFAQSCPTLWDPMDYSTPGLPCPSPTPCACSNSCPLRVMPSNPLILCHPRLLPPSIFPASGYFAMSQFFTLGDQNVGVSASASVSPLNIQDWSPLGWTGWIPLQSKGLSRVFSNTIGQKHQFGC